MTTTNTDGIKKQIVLRATPARVWRAVSNAREFGTWFGVELRDDFAPGAVVRGTVVYKGRQLPITFQIERMEPERLLAFRWHPYAVDPAIDYAGEPTTLVEFRLTEARGGIELTVVESGFDRVPLERRAEAYRMNSQGWSAQMESIERYVSAT